MQEGSVMKYLRLSIAQFHLGFSIDQTNHIMELVSEWFPDGKFWKVDTPSWTDCLYENKFMTPVNQLVDNL